MWVIYGIFFYHCYNGDLCFFYILCFGDRDYIIIDLWISFFIFVLFGLGSMIISGILLWGYPFHILFLWWFLFCLSLILCDMDYPWLMIILFFFRCLVWVMGIWSLFYDHCYLWDVIWFVFFGIPMYVIILSLFYDHCFWDGCKGFFYYPWSMMSFDLNCVCWWEM